MLTVSRTAALAVLAVLALGTAGCGSNNKGKIEGQWRASNLPGMTEEQKGIFKKIGEDNVKLIMEFANGKMTMNVSISFLGKTESKQLASADYSLGSGDTVFFTNVTPPTKTGATKSRDKIKIEGDTMTIATESGENLVLSRVK